MAEAPPSDLAIPLPAQGANSLAYWTQQIEFSKEAINKTREKFRWNVNNLRFVGKRDDTQALQKHEINLPKDFSYAEQKSALLFFQTPDLTLTPARPDVSAETAQLAQAVLNELIGEDQLNCKATIDEILKDVLIPAGFGVAVIGYEAFTDPEQPTVPMQVGEEPALDDLGQPLMQPAGPAPMDAFGLPAGPPPMAPVMQPIMEDVPNIIRERYFCERVSPVDFLYPTSFRGSDWQKAPWLGYRFRASAQITSQTFGVDLARVQGLKPTGEITPDQSQSLAPDRNIQHFEGVEGIVIWYRAIEVDPSVGDPERIRQLVLIRDNVPIVHRDSPFQTIEGNRYVSGLRGYPIYPLTLRYVPDSPIPPSDCSMSRVLVDELSNGRTQMLNQRDRNITTRGINIDKVAPADAQKVVNPAWGELIPFTGLEAGESPIFGIPQNAWPDENFTFNNIGDRDIQETWSISANQLGVNQTAGRTATEISTMQAATETRLEAERNRVLRWWVQVGQGLFALVQRYADVPQYTAVLGQDGATKLTEWTKQDIQGTFAFTAKPDSSRRIDQAAERKFRVDVFNLLANDPTLNRQALIQWMAPTLGLDPQKLFLPPQPPPGPEVRTSVSVTVSVADLANPITAPVAIPILQKQGLLPPNYQQPPAPAGQPPMQQAPSRIEPVNQHQADQTGRLPGAGAASGTVQ